MNTLCVSFYPASARPAGCQGNPSPSRLRSLNMVPQAHRYANASTTVQLCYTLCSPEHRASRNLDARVGIEPTLVTVLQTVAFPIGHLAVLFIEVTTNFHRISPAAP